MIKGVDYSSAVQEAFNAQELWASKIRCRNVDELNDAVKRGRAAGYILISEALQERKIADIADYVAEHPEIKIVLIAGPSSSGKTSFAQRLRIQLGVNAIGTETLSMDNYFVNRVDSPRKPDGSYDFECPEAVDVELFNRQLSALAAGEKVEIPRYNFKTGKKEYDGETIQLDDHKVLIVEGIHALNDKMTSLLDASKKLKVYITPLNPLDLPDGTNVNPADVRLIRRIVRDNQYRNLSAKDTLKMWETVRDGEKKYIFPSADGADVIVNTSLIYELSVLKPYAQPLLEELADDDGRIGNKVRELLYILSKLDVIPTEDIPRTSIMREFVGGSTFKKHL